MKRCCSLDMFCKLGFYSHAGSLGTCMHCLCLLEIHTSISIGSENSCSPRTHLTCPFWQISNSFGHKPFFFLRFFSPVGKINLWCPSICPDTHTYICNMEKKNCLKPSSRSQCGAEGTACTPESDKCRFNPNPTSSVALGMLLNLPEPQCCISEKWADSVYFHSVCVCIRWNEACVEASGTRLVSLKYDSPSSLLFTKSQAETFENTLVIFLNAHKTLHQIISHKKPSWNVFPLPSLQVFINRVI